MKAWSAWYPFVLPSVLGCPEPTVDHALLQAAREFCQRSRAWVETSDAFTASGATQRFDFDLTSQQELVHVMGCKVGADPFKVLASDDLPAGWGDQVTSSDDPEDALVLISNQEYMLYPTPAAGKSIVLELALKPTASATQVGDMVFDKWADLVASGAIARLAAMPRVDWRDAELAKLHRGLFESGIHSAANDRFRQAGTAQRRTKSYG